MMRWSLAHSASSPHASALLAIWSNVARPASSPRTTIDIPYCITHLLPSLSDPDLARDFRVVDGLIRDEFRHLRRVQVIEVRLYHPALASARLSRSLRAGGAMLR